MQKERERETGSTKKKERRKTKEGRDEYGGAIALSLGCPARPPEPHTSVTVHYGTELVLASVSPFHLNEVPEQ